MEKVRHWLKGGLGHGSVGGWAEMLRGTSLLVDGLEMWGC